MFRRGAQAAVRKQVVQSEVTDRKQDPKSSKKECWGVSRRVLTVVMEAGNIEGRSVLGTGAWWELTCGPGAKAVARCCAVPVF